MKIDLSSPQSDLLAAIHDAGETGMVVPGTKGSTAKVLRSYELIATVPDTKPPKQRITAAGLVWLAEHGHEAIFPCPEGVPQKAWEIIRPIALALCAREIPCFLGWTKTTGATWPTAILAFPVEGEEAVTVMLRPAPLPSAINPGRRRLYLSSEEEHRGTAQWREETPGQGLPVDEIVREVLRHRGYLREDRATRRRCKSAQNEADRLNEAAGVPSTETSMTTVRAGVRTMTGELCLLANVDCTPEQAEAMLNCAKRVGLIPSPPAEPT